MTTKVYPIFPVAITKENFDNNGETSHGGGTVFPEGVVNIENEAYRFNINGKLIQGVVLEDYGVANIRLTYPHVDTRQMKVCLMESNNLIEGIFYITYYQLDCPLREVICVISYKQ